MILQITSKNLDDTLKLAEKLGSSLASNKVINLVGDVGSGKTTFTKGLAKGMGCNDDVSSPSFTIMRKYKCTNDFELHHYDFYRLNESGVMQMELQESINSKKTVTAIEWADIVQSVIPRGSIVISFTTKSENERIIKIEGLEGVKEI